MKKILFILLLPIILFSSIQKVSVQLEWKHQFEFAGFYAAIAQGYYKEIGLEVELKEYQSAINISDDVVNQKSTFGISSSSLILERLRNKPVVLLASYFKRNTLALVTKPNIKSPSDLKGKKIMAVDWEMEHTSIGVLLKEHNINKKDFTFIDSDFKIDKFVNGEIDAMSIFITNQLYLLDKLKIKYNIINPSDYGIYSYDVELFTSETIVKKYPDMVKKFTEATNKGWKYAFEHKKEIINIIYDKYTKIKSKNALLFEANETEKVFRTNVFKIGSIAPELIQLNANIFEKLNLVQNVNIKKLLSSYIFQQPINKRTIDSLSDNDIEELKKQWQFNEQNNPLTFEEQQYLKTNKITMCVDPDWMPFEKLKNGKHVGMSADLFKIIEKNLNTIITIIPTSSWSQSIEFAKQRKCDILSLAMPTPERDKYMNFTSPYTSGPLVLATKENVPFVLDLKDLNNLKIGIPKGYSSSEILRKKYPNINIVDVNNIRDGLNKVRDGQLFGYIGTLPNIGYMFQKEFTGQLKIAGKFDELWKLGIAVRNDNLILLNIFQKAIDSVSKTQQQTILNKWVSINYESRIDYALVWKILFVSVLLFLLFIYSNRKLSKLNKELEIAKNKAEESMQVKSNFLTNVSHEIRTPMNSIVGLIYLIKQTQLTKIQDNYIKKIDTASNNLLILINDILDLSKMEAKKMNLSNANFNLLEILDNLNNMIRIKTDEKDLIFNIKYDKSENLNLYGDSIKLSQILNNLTSNAVKFTKKGSIDLIVEKISDERFKFSIIDTGIGLTQKQISKLFSSFTQADNSTTREYGGTGLGLAISKELVELMGGIIWIESKYTEGSKFIFEIDLKTRKVDTTNKINILKVNVPTNKNLTKKVLNAYDKSILHKKLTNAVTSRRPNNCQPVINEIELYALDQQDQELFNKIKKLVNQYKFNEAKELLNEK